MEIAQERGPGKERQELNGVRRGYKIGREGTKGSVSTKACADSNKLRVLWVSGVTLPISSETLEEKLHELSREQEAGKEEIGKQLNYCTAVLEDQRMWGSSV